MVRVNSLTWLERLAGAALIAMLALTTVDVLGRYLFSRPVAGVIELTQYTMMLLVFAALPVVTRRRQHIAVGLLDGRLGAKARRIQSAAIDLFCALVLATLAWTLFEIAATMRSQRDVIGLLRLSTYPAAYVMSALSLVTAVVCAMRAGSAALGRDGNPTGR
jgi:TRAP-type C4-dicarboxylate transport system permease small subunit